MRTPAAAKANFTLCETWVALVPRRLDAGHGRLAQEVPAENQRRAQTHGAQVSGPAVGHEGGN